MGAFEIVILAVIVGGVALAVMLLITTASTWRDYGRGHLSMEHDTSLASGSADELEREQEIRQLLEARNELRNRRGRPVVDVERELQRLTAPKIDAALREEIRELVIARNHRRQRVGKPPLDVEAEVERRVAEFSEGGASSRRERRHSP